MRIAFDLDGTLIDSIHHIHTAVSLALAEMSLGEIDKDRLQTFVGNGLPTLIARVGAHLGLAESALNELETRSLHHYTTRPSDPAIVYPGVHDALTALRDAGHALAICTNKPFQATLAAMRDTKLESYFDLMIGGDSLPTRKPAPGMLLACAPDLYVGDSEVDADTAQNARLPFLLFTEGYRKTPLDEIAKSDAFSHYDALPRLVAKHQA
ncbi:HAD-IA family hydrolase [Roseobacteraceae bacterium S113]